MEKLLPEFKRRLTRALRSDQYPQTTGVMHTRYGNENEKFAKDKFCFYGVLLDLLQNGAGWTPAQLDGSVGGSTSYHTHKGGGASSNPPFGDDEMEWWREGTGLTTKDPTVILNGEEASWHPNRVESGRSYSLMTLNDYGYTFAELSLIVDRCL